MYNVIEGKLIEFINPGINIDILGWDLVPTGDSFDDDEVKFNMYVANSPSNGGGVICLSESYKDPLKLYNG